MLNWGLKTCFLFLFSQILVAQSALLEKEVILKTKTGKLSGSWVVPQGSKTFPAVLIIAGSGPTDRNGNNPLAGENNSLKMLAEALAEKNIASLRYDKRGIGKSIDAGKDESSMTFDLLVEDASAWVQWMRKQKAVQKVWVAGHSEGSLIGMLAAEKQKADGFVSIAGSGQRASQTLRVQLEKQPDMIKNEAYRVIDSLEKGVIVKDVNPLLITLFRESIQPYLINWFKYDPCAEIRKLKTPILIVQGDADLQLKVWDAERLHVCNMNSQMDIIDDMNHVLKVLSSPDDMNENIASYSNPNLPISARMMAIITEFINRNN